MAEGIHFVNTMDNSDFLRGVNQMQSALQEVADQTVQEGELIDRMTSKLGNLAAGLGVAFSATAFTKQVVQTRGEFQSLEMSFNTLLQSEERSAELMNQLVKTAATTPFDLKGVANGAKQLLAYGVEADKVNDKIVELGNIAAGLSLPLNDLVMLYGTTISKGDIGMDTLDLKQFKQRGIAIDEAIAEVMHVNKQAVPELISAHKVTGDIVEKAVANLAGGEGQFAGMMINQSKTILGQISNIGDSIDMMFNNIGKQSEGVISGALSTVAYIVENYEEVGKELLKIAAAYGTYKAVLAGFAAYHKAVVEQEADAYRQLLPQKEQELATDLQESVNKKMISAERAAEIQKLREEAAAHVELLNTKKIEAAEELKAATAAKNAAMARSQAANEQLDVAKSQLKVAIQSGNAEEIAAAKAAVGTAQREVNTTAVARNNAVKQASIASHRATAAATAYETAQVNLNTAAQTRGLTATTLFAKAQKGLASIMKATGLSMLANPYVAAAAAIAAAVYGISKAYQAATADAKAMKEINDRVNSSYASAESKAAGEIVSLNELTKQMKAAGKGTDEYNRIKQTIIDQYGKYHQGLEREIELLEDEDEIVKILTSDIRKRYMQEAYSKAMEEANNKYTESVTKPLQQIYDNIMAMRDKKMAELKGSDSQEIANQREQIKRDYQRYYEEVAAAITNGSIGVERATTQSSAKIIGISEEANKALQQTKTYSGGGYGATTYTFVESVIQDQVSKVAAASDRLNVETEKLRGRFNEFLTVETANTNEEMANALPTDANGKPLNLDAVINGILESTQKLKEARHKMSQGLTHLIDVGGEQKEVDYSDVVAEQENAVKKYKELYQLMTGEQYGKDTTNTADLLAKVKSANKALTDFQTRAAAELSAEELKMLRDAQELQINAMEGGYDKRLATLRLGQAKEQDALNKEYADKKKAIIARAKEEFDLEEDLRLAQLEANGQTGERREFNVATDLKQTYIEQLDEADAALTEHRFALNRKQMTDLSKFNADELNVAQRFFADYLKLESDWAESRASIEERANKGLISKNTADVLLKQANDEFERAKAAGGYTEDKLQGSLVSMSGLAEQVATASIETLVEMYNDAIAQLGDVAADSEAAVELKAKAAYLAGKIKETSEKSPDQTDMEKWNELKGALTDCASAAGDLGSQIGDSTEQIVTRIQEVTNITISLISNIEKFTEVSSKSIEATATTGQKAIVAIERASVILAIISAVIQLAEKAVELGEKLKNRKANESKQKTEEINKMTSAVYQYEQSIKRAENAEKNWFASNGLSKLKEQAKLSSDALSQYYKKLNEEQAAYQDEQGGGVFNKLTRGIQQFSTKISLPIAKEIAQTWERVYDDVLNDQEVEDMAGKYRKAMDNLRVETRASSKGFLGLGAKSQQTTDIQSFIDSQEKFNGAQLFDESGMINYELAQTLLENYGDKMVGDTKATIEELVGLREEYDEWVKSLEDYVSGMFSPLTDDLTDALFTWLDTGDDVLETFKNNASDTFRQVGQDMLKQMAQEAVFSGFSEEMKELYKAYGEGRISESELTQGVANASENLAGKVEQYAPVLEQSLKTYSEAMKTAGYDIQASAEQQSATVGGFETMSQDTGTELNGRFTALQMAGEDIRQCVALQLVELAAFNENAAAGLATLSDIREQAAIANNYLADLVKNSNILNNVALPLIQNIDTNIKNL